jgi:predicted metal-binding protein
VVAKKLICFVCLLLLCDEDGGEKTEQSERSRLFICKLCHVKKKAENRNR